jgi:pyruvate/2-oxoglutarate/acetoin dehydrogenase E1 component
MVHFALQPADALESDGISAEVNPGSLDPLDADTLVASPARPIPRAEVITMSTSRRRAMCFAPVAVYVEA